MDDAGHGSDRNDDLGVVDPLRLPRWVGPMAGRLATLLHVVWLFVVLALVDVVLRSGMLVGPGAPRLGAIGPDYLPSRLDTALPILLPAALLWATRAPGGARPRSSSAPARLASGS